MVYNIVGLKFETHVTNFVQTNATNTKKKLGERERERERGRVRE